MGPIGSQYRQVGNAVPPSLGYIFAREISLIQSSGNNVSRKVEFAPHSISQVISKIKKYGTPNLGNLTNPLDELVYLYISHRTFEKAYQQVYKSLRSAYPSSEKLRKAKLNDVIRILEPSGLAKQKAETILKALTKIKLDFKETSMRKLSNMSEDAQLNYLLTLPRVGIKTAYCVMMYSFGIEVLPIDANIRRVCQRLGWLPHNIDDGKEHSIIHAIIPPKERYSFHVNCICHARSICIPIQPRCGECNIADFCPKNIWFKKK